MALNNKQKWSRVDRIIENIEHRKSKGLTPYLSELDEYIDNEFNKGTEAVSREGS